MLYVAHFKTFVLRFIKRLRKAWTRVCRRILSEIRTQDRCSTIRWTNLAYFLRI